MANAYLPGANQYYGPGMGPQQNPYGYAQAPGGPYGYYEQQTPGGSFAAANQQRAGTAQANVTGAVNPFIGQTTQSIGGANSVLPYAQQVATKAIASNPYLDKTTQQATVGTNAMAGVDNPYLNSAINNASQDAIRNYSTFTQPMRERQMQQSGSFGNSGVQQMQLEDQRNLQGTLGNIATNARMADYNQQFGAAESQANRSTQGSQFNSALNAADLGRQTGGFYTGQGLGISGLNSLVDAAKFDSGMGVDVGKFNAGLGQADLGRNAGLAQGQGQFNAGAMNQGAQFNAGAQNTGNMFNAGQGNALNQFNTGQANQMLEGGRNRDQNRYMFDENLDFNINRSNFDQGIQGINTAQSLYNNAVQNGILQNQLGSEDSNAEMQRWLQLMGGAAQGGGQGGTASQPTYSDPWSSGLGMYAMLNSLIKP
jgi:hypothetical protein